MRPRGEAKYACVFVLMRQDGENRDIDLKSDQKNIHNTIQMRPRGEAKYVCVFVLMRQDREI